MNETEQRYHSNKQEFLTLKWVVTEQFHEYLSPYGKNRNEFVVCTDNNPLTYIFSSANLDAAGQQWVARLASYNFSLEYQKGKDNTVANFLSQMNERLPEEEVQEYLNKIPYPRVKAVLDNAIMPIKECAEQGVRPTPDCQGDCQEETVGARPMRLATTNVTDWKQEQKDPVILGTPTIYRVMEVIKESKISKLAVPWTSSRVSWLMRDVQARLGQVVVNDVANKPISPLNVDEVVRVASKCTVPPLVTKPFMVRSILSYMVTR